MPLTKEQRYEQTRTQRQRVLEYLRTGRKLTNLIAVGHLRIGSLSSRIAELRKDGHEIKDAWKSDTYGARYKEYWLEQGE